MKEYTISLLEKDAEIQFDSLPVAKITRYPLEQGDYKPYAQGTLCLSENRLGLRLLSFEVKPQKTSKIGMVLYPYNDSPEEFIEIWCSPEGAEAFNSVGEKIKAQFHPKNGEDLQGVYWGYDVFVDKKDLNAKGEIAWKIGNRIQGNFFKIQEGEGSHYGAFDLAEFGQPRIYHKEKMAKFEIVGY